MNFISTILLIFSFSVFASSKIGIDFVNKGVKSRINLEVIEGSTKFFENRGKKYQIKLSKKIPEKFHKMAFGSSKSAVLLEVFPVGKEDESASLFAESKNNNYIQTIIEGENVEMKVLPISL